MQKLLSLNDAAEILRIKKSTLYAWVHYKKIPYVKIGSKIAFVEEQLEEFVNSKIYKERN